MDPYQEELLDHYERPRHRGSLPDPTGTAEVKNPLCGDRVVVDARVEDGRLAAIAVSGEGCVISQAGADLLAEALLGKTVEEVAAMGTDDVLRLLGIPPNPTRLKCALLGLEGLQRAAQPRS